MIIFAIGFALLLNYVKNKTTYGTDTIISVFSSIAIALGLAILAQTGNFNQYSSYLVGDILSITDSEILYVFIIAIVVLVFWYFAFNKLHLISINTTLAKSKGIKTKKIDNIFAILIAIVVMVSIRWIGILLINSLLIYSKIQLLPNLILKKYIYPKIYPFLLNFLIYLHKNIYNIL